MGRVSAGPGFWERETVALPSRLVGVAMSWWMLGAPGVGGPPCSPALGDARVSTGLDVCPQPAGDGNGVARGMSPGLCHDGVRCPGVPKVCGLCSWGKLCTVHDHPPCISQGLQLVKSAPKNTPRALPISKKRSQGFPHHQHSPVPAVPPAPSLKAP